MSSLRRKLWKWTAGTFAVLVILLGLGLGMFRIVLDQVPDYRVQIQEWISERSGLKIAFSGIDARWRIYGPELVFEDAVVSTPDGGRTLVQARQGSVAFDLWGSIASGRITTGRFWLDAPQLLLVRTVEGRIELLGQDELPERTTPFSFDALPTGRFSISNARVLFRDLATGRGPWEFARVGLTLLRAADTMRLQGTAELPSALGKQLKFAARSAGQLDRPATLHWNFELEGSDLALAGLAGLLPDEWPAPAAGKGSFKLAGIFKGNRVEALSGNLDVTGATLPLPAWNQPVPVANPLAFDLIRTTFDMRRTQEGGWHLLLDGLQLVRPGTRWDPSRIEIDVGNMAAGQINVRGTAKLLVLDSVWPLLAYLPEQPDTARLRALAATGRLSNLSVRYERANADAPPAYLFAGRFDDVAFAPAGSTPGVGGLTGNLLATEQSGRLQLAARRFLLTLPQAFPEPLHADALAGLVTWTRETDRWRVASDNVEVSSADGKASAHFELVLPDDGSSPVLDLEASGTDIEATAMPRYLPLNRLSERSLAWLGRAFPAGKISKASLAYHGPMRAFPFRGGEGTFVARGQLEDITLDYDPRWAPITEINGEIEFRNAGLEASTTGGLVHGLRIAAGHVGIADLKTAELDITAKANGDLGAALDYLHRSSIGPGLGERFMALTGNGATTLDARLWLPVKEIEKRKIDVTARLVNAELADRNVSQKLTALNGSVQVLDRALVSPGLQGRFLGGPLTLTMIAQAGAPAGPATTVLSAAGRALAAPLKELFGLPEVAGLTGATGWRMQARFVPRAGAPLQQSYVIDADLAGFGIGLAAPVRKAPAERRPLHAEFEFDGNPAFLVRGNLGNVTTVARFNREAGAWKFDRAGVRADGIAASIPGHEGVRIEGDVQSFVLDDWLALKGSGSGAGSGWHLNNYLKAANVRVGAFRLFGYTWSDVRGLLQATDAGWQIDVSGPDATGQVRVPYDLGAGMPLDLDMERLVIAARTGRAGAAAMTDPRQVPPIQARINEFELGARRLGNVRAQLDRVPGGLGITSLTAQSESFSAELKGSWLSHDVPGSASRSISTAVEGTLTSTDVQSTLKALGYGDVIAGSRGLLQAQLTWPGGPDAEALGRASGTVHLELDDGQMLDLQPGAGRVLGLMSVAALPRRLSLDFSDLTDKGLAFDEVRGDFELKQGNAYTSNLKLTGPAADIGIAGRVGLGARDYDQTAVVTGNIGATLPVAGVLAGGPVIGAAMLLFSQVFKEPLKGITRGYYRITGNWDEPQIERVVASDAKEAATHQ